MKNQFYMSVGVWGKSLPSLLKQHKVMTSELQPLKSVHVPFTPFEIEILTSNLPEPICASQLECTSESRFEIIYAYLSLGNFEAKSLRPDT